MSRESQSTRADCNRNACDFHEHVAFEPEGQHQGEDRYKQHT